MESTQSLPRPATVPLADRKSPTPRIEYEMVDLDIYPGIDTARVITQSDVFLGDMHGNSKKLLYHLIKEGIFSVSESDYNQFVQIYNRSQTLTVDDKQKLDAIMQRVTLKSHPKCLHLLGDLLADRGNNDYLTLKIIEKLGKLGVNYDILFSNHDAWFLQAMDTQWRSVMDSEFASSLRGFQNTWMQMDVDERSKIHEIIELHYKPKLKLLSGIVTQSEPQALPTFFAISHAPLALHEPVEWLAAYFQVPYSGQTVSELMQVRLQINQAFKKHLIEHPQAFWMQWHDHYETYRALKKSKQLTSKKLKDIPLVFTVWNREYPSDLSWKSTEYHAVGIHGHESEGLNDSPYRYNLDNGLGKGAGSEKGKYLHFAVENAYSLEEWLALSALSPKPASAFWRYLCYVVAGVTLGAGIVAVGGYLGARYIHSSLGWGVAIGDSPGIGQLSSPALIAIGGVVCLLAFLSCRKLSDSWAMSRAGSSDSEPSSIRAVSCC